MFGSILRQVTRVNPSNLLMKRSIITQTGAIEKMPSGVGKISPLMVPVVVAVGCYCGAKASEYGAWLLKEFSLFEYDDDDDDDD